MSVSLGCLMLILLQPARTAGPVFFTTDTTFRNAVGGADLELESFESSFVNGRSVAFDDVTVIGDETLVQVMPSSLSTDGLGTIGMVDNGFNGNIVTFAFNSPINVFSVDVLGANDFGGGGTITVNNSNGASLVLYTGQRPVQGLSYVGLIDDTTPFTRVTIVTSLRGDGLQVDRVRYGLVNFDGPADPRPSTPTGLGSIPVDPFGVRLFWNATPGASSYRLLVNGPGVFFNQNIGNTTAVQGVALPGGSYAAQLFAVNAAGESLTPASHDFAIGCAAPGPVAPPGVNPFVIGKQGNSVSVTWSAASGATEYVLEVTTQTGDLLSFATPTTALFAAQAPTGVYLLRVYGRNACGAGPATSPSVALTIP